MTLKSVDQHQTSSVPRHLLAASTRTGWWTRSHTQGRSRWVLNLSSPFSLPQLPPLPPVPATATSYSSNWRNASDASGSVRTFTGKANPSSEHCLPTSSSVRPSPWSPGGVAAVSAPFADAIAADSDSLLFWWLLDFPFARAVSAGEIAVFYYFGRRRFRVCTAIGWSRSSKGPRQPPASSRPSAPPPSSDLAADSFEERPKDRSTVILLPSRFENVQNI